MDPLIGGALIKGGADIAGGVMGGKAAKQAAKYQSQATDKALAFQREQEAARKANYEKAYGMWLSSRNQLLERYGLPTQGMPPGGGGPPGMPPGGGMPAQGAPMAVPQPMASPVRPAVGQNLGEMIASGQEPPPDWLPQLPGMRSA